VASWLEVEAVAPAISVALGYGGQSMRLGWQGNRKSKDFRCGNIGIASGLTSQNLGTLIGGNFEVDFEVGESMLCDGKFAPISHVVGKGTGLFKVVDGGAEDGCIADGFCCTISEVLTLFNLVPKVGQWLFGTPLAAQIF
jgi:hypothetical protein